MCCAPAPFAFSQSTHFGVQRLRMVNIGGTCHDGDGLSLEGTEVGDMKLRIVYVGRS